MKDAELPTIVICSSANFYKQAVEIQEELEKLGFPVVVPKTARRMKETGGYDVEHYKTWFADPGDYDKKAALMHGHFDEIAAGDVILVLNAEKRGQANYIGGNVLMEMALAFHLGKPIFLFNDFPEESNFDEEIRGMQPTVLKGDAKALAKHYKLGAAAGA